MTKNLSWYLYPHDVPSLMVFISLGTHSYMPPCSDDPNNKGTHLRTQKENQVALMDIRSNSHTANYTQRSTAQNDP